MPSPPRSALSHEDAGVHPSELPRAIFHALATEFGDHVRVTDRSNARIVHAMHFAVCDEAGVERHVEPASSLSTEISAVPSDIQTHFLSELPKHATMLVMAIGDACSGLLTLGPSLPFSSTGVARMLLEAAGDLHWLVDADPGLAASERARRAITVYLRQTETTIRQLEQLRERTSQDDYDAGIAEGWELLRHTADSAALGGYRVKESRRPGQKYILHPGKPSISRLVDEAITRFYGSTGVNLYSLYSSTATEDALASVRGFQDDLDHNGFGLWAVEVRASGEFIGFTGLDVVDDGMPFTGVEVGWRLARSAWGHGYATAAAIVALEHGFATVGLPEILAVTTKTNLRSQAVMRRIGMTYDPAEDFDDPDVEEGPLCRAVLYRKLPDAVRPDAG